MDYKRITKQSFIVIGKEGSTEEGEGFIQRLWAEANSHFAEIQHLARKDAAGNLLGIWGIMSAFSRDFQPWEDFQHGLYLAGAECEDGAEAPQGWQKWRVPGYEYIRAEVSGGDTFTGTLRYLEENRLALAGAVHDFTDPQSGKNYMFFPIKKL